MIVGIQGTTRFNDYSVFIRAMGVAMSSIKDDDPYFYLYSAGPVNINAMASEFTNLSERGMKARGKKIKFYKVPPSWIAENLDSVDYLAYLSTPQDSVSKLVSQAQLQDVEVGIFQY